MTYDIQKTYGIAKNGIIEIIPLQKASIQKDGNYLYSEKTSDEMSGAKEIIQYEKMVVTTPYEQLVTTLVETDTTIGYVYSIQELSPQAIIQINEEFWNANFTKVDLENNFYICNWFKDKAGGISETINDIYPVLVTRSVIYGMMPPEQLESMSPQTISVFNAPNLSQKFTQDYIKSLLVMVTDPTQMANILQKMGEIQADVDTYPSMM